jgi:predicted membrane-bound spermidine synthase
MLKMRIERKIVGRGLMAKVSDIEQKKLQATYYNNLSVGLLLAGLLVPYLGITQHLGSIINRITGTSPLTFAEMANSIASIVAMIMALYGAKRMRRLAKSTIASIDEEAQPSKS